MIHKLGICLLVVFIFWPWGIMIVDINFWMLFGEQLSNIPWNSVRGFIMMVWPIGASVITAWLTSL